MLLRSVTIFVNCVLRGETAVPARASFFGTTLIALNKKGGGFRPIAVGCTLRRLVAKCAGSCVKEAMTALLAPHPLGFGVPLGAEAAVHASRIFLNNLQPGHLILKLDFRNAFNSLRQDRMIAAMEQLAPELLPLVTCANSAPSFPFLGKTLYHPQKVCNRVTPLAHCSSALLSMTCCNSCKASSMFPS